jgi:hypothetical protein
MTDTPIDFTEIVDDTLVVLLRQLDSIFASTSTIKIDLHNEITHSDTDDGTAERQTYNDMIENSMIGSLAKEISEEINFKDLNITNPNDLLNFDNLTNSNNVLGQIVSKVSSKIQNKIANGNLNQADLMGEAMNLMNVFQNNKTPGSDVFANLMREMSANVGSSTNNRAHSHKNNNRSQKQKHLKNA